MKYIFTLALFYFLSYSVCSALELPKRDQVESDMKSTLTINMFKFSEKMRAHCGMKDYIPKMDVSLHDYQIENEPKPENELFAADITYTIHYDGYVMTAKNQPHSRNPSITSCKKVSKDLHFNGQIIYMKSFNKKRWMIFDMAGRKITEALQKQLIEFK